MFFQVSVISEADQHGQHRGNRQSQQHADKTKQLCACQYSKDYRHRVQSNTVAYQERRQHHTFQGLTNAKDESNIDQVDWFLELEPIFDTPEFESLKEQIGL